MPDRSALCRPRDRGPLALPPNKKALRIRRPSAPRIYLLRWILTEQTIAAGLGHHAGLPLHSCCGSNSPKRCRPYWRPAAALETR